MEQIEQNVMDSFRLAKTDIIKLQNDILELNRSQTKIIELVRGLRASELYFHQKVKQLNSAKAIEYKRPVIVKKNIIRAVAKAPVKPVRHFARKHLVIVATKGSNKFHKVNCPYAKNIKPKNKIRFHSKVKALNEGFKACQCVQ